MVLFRNLRARKKVYWIDRNSSACTVPLAFKSSLLSSCLLCLFFVVLIKSNNKFAFPDQNDSWVAWCSRLLFVVTDEELLRIYCWPFVARRLFFGLFFFSITLAFPPCIHVYAAPWSLYVTAKFNNRYVYSRCVLHDIPTYLRYDVNTKQPLTATYVRDKHISLLFSLLIL